MPRTRSRSRVHRLVAALALAASVMGSAALGADLPPPGDRDRGARLYENHCRVCHTSEVHIRERRKGVDAAAVHVQIRRWQKYLGLAWSAQEDEDVFAYLNHRFYRF